MSNLKENILNKINESILYEEPFDHLYIENFFDNSFYKEILSNMPKINEYTHLASTDRVRGNYSKERFF